jgi:tryptophan-rich sensory protein
VRALRAWGWQLALQTAWTPVFFGLHWLLGSVLVGAGALAAAVFTLLAFMRLNRLAAALMLPYCLAVGVQLYLDTGFWWLNA